MFKNKTFIEGTRILAKLEPIFNIQEICRYINELEDMWTCASFQLQVHVYCGVLEPLSLYCLISIHSGLILDLVNIYSVSPHLPSKSIGCKWWMNAIKPGSHYKITLLISWPACRLRVVLTCKRSAQQWFPQFSFGFGRLYLTSYEALTTPL